MSLETPLKTEFLPPNSGSKKCLEKSLFTCIFYVACPDTKAICNNLSRNFLLELGFLLSDHNSSEEIFF